MDSWIKRLLALLRDSGARARPEPVPGDPTERLDAARQRLKRTIEEPADETSS